MELKIISCPFIIFKHFWKTYDLLYIKALKSIQIVIDTKGFQVPLFLHGV